MDIPCDASSIISATFSKPTADAFADKLKLRKNSASTFTADYFKGPKAFRDEWTTAQVDEFISKAEAQFHAIVMDTADKTITALTSRKGKTTILVKARQGNSCKEDQTGSRKGSGAADADRASSAFKAGHAPADRASSAFKAPGTTTDKATSADKAPGAVSPATAFTKVPHNRVKNYILPEGEPVPFLVQLGVMTADGKVHAQKYDKFRQINRFLEFVDDILPEIQAAHEDAFPGTPLRIIDFGCGKSYLTFAIYHYLVVKKGLPAEIFGLDLKKDVIEDCSRLATSCGYAGLRFACGDIADYRAENAGQGAPLDLVITLHACDTATDYALAFAVEHGARAILSVPCCQHELNTALGRTAHDDALNPLLKYGIVKERFAALATDVLRAETLSAHNYKTQLLEFIDMEHTPKNILIRAVLKERAGSSLSQAAGADKASSAVKAGTPLPAADVADKTSAAFKARGAALSADATALKNALGVELTLERLLRQ